MPGWINLVVPQQIEQARLHSPCTSFYSFVAGHGARGDKGLVQSLVETGYDLFQVFTLLDYQCLVRLMLMRTTNESWWSKWPLELDTVGAEVLSS